MDTLNTDLATRDENSVQKRTAVITPEILHYVNSYRSFVRKTAESVIGLAVTVVEAEDHLSPNDFEFFCSEIRVMKGGSFYKKLKTIGKAAQRLQVVKDVLPNSWTTVYNLAKLNNEQFDQVSGANILTPTVTAREINEFLGKEPKKHCMSALTKSEANVVSVDLNGLDQNSRTIVMGLLVSIASTYNCQVKAPDLAKSNVVLVA